MPKKLVSSPDPIVEPVTLDEAKAHIRVAVVDDDAYITGLITECRGLIENCTERALVPQTWDVFFDEFPRHRSGSFANPYGGEYAHLGEYSDYPERFSREAFFELPLPPLQSIASITYVDAAGAPQTLDPALYLVDDASEPARIYPAYGQAWPTARRQRNAVTVRIITGFPDAASVPATIKGAIKKFVAHFYENREPISAVTGVTPSELPLHLQEELSYERDASSWI